MMTAAGVRTESRGNACVVSFEHAPKNCLSDSLRSALVGALDGAMASEAVRTIVLVGTGAAFSVGADVREVGPRAAEEEPTLRSLIDVIDGSPKPVIAAISGYCLGGGLEIALACHFRVALADATLGFPEASLGMIPCAGGTQRLPRLVGVERALSLLLSGALVQVDRLADTPLLDAIVAGDIVAGAVEFADRVVRERLPVNLARGRDVRLPNADGFFQFVRASLPSIAMIGPAAAKCVDAVEAAIKRPFDEGLAVEKRCFEELVSSPESRALRHVVRAEQAAVRIPGIAPSTHIRPIARVAVIGAGTMGAGIAMSFLSANIPVILVDATPQALARGVSTIGRHYEAAVKKGRLPEANASRASSLLQPTLEYDAIRGCDLCIEAVYEDIAVKRQVMCQLDDISKSGAILATNTSTLDVDRIASFTRRPQDVLGMHFFSPANVMKLLEVVRGAETASDVLATIMALAKAINKIAVVSGVCDGFIGNRMFQAYLRQAFLLLEDGALPNEIDAALERFGMAMGPFRVGDLAGNDVGWSIRKRRRVERPEITYSGIPDRLCERGRFGQKTGKGWYRYAQGSREPEVDPEVTRLIEDYRAERGITPRCVAEDEIVERCVFALVNEGARILDEGVALRASDIDLVYLMGYGFPSIHGGPMFYANTVGLYRIERAMRRFAADPKAQARGDARFWTPAPLVAGLAAAGRGFGTETAS
jgi:3-hydroxyacyl-CoA dehydrogenase